MILNTRARVVSLRMLNEIEATLSLKLMSHNFEFEARHTSIDLRSSSVAGNTESYCDLK